MLIFSLMITHNLTYPWQQALSRAHSEEVRCVKEEFVMEKEKELSKLQKRLEQQYQQKMEEMTVKHEKAMKV